MAFPTMNSFEKASKISIEIVNELRYKALERIIQNPELYYEKDIDTIKSNDWWIRRFLHQQKQEQDKALDSLDKVLRWRKTFGVLDMSNKDFAKEAFKSAMAILYGKDVNGSQLLIFRLRFARKFTAWIPTAKRFLAYMVELADSNDNGKGATLLVDCKGSCFRNVETYFMNFVKIVLTEYYPGLFNSVLIYELPKGLKAIYQLVRSGLTKEQDKCCYLINKTNINDYVAISQLPDFLLGENQEPYRIVPPDSPTVHELAQRLGITSDNSDKMVKHLEQFYTE